MGLDYFFANQQKKKRVFFALLFFKKSTDFCFSFFCLPFHSLLSAYCKRGEHKIGPKREGGRQFI